LRRNIPCEETPPAPTAEIPVINLSYEEFKELWDSSADFVLLDTRPEELYKIGHIPKAESFPLRDINPTSVERLPNNKLIIVYCQSASCGVSHVAAVKLIGLGYNVKDYKGGATEWTNKGNALQGDPSAIPSVSTPNK